ncbi:MAG: hypothetical protein ACXWNN_12775 [Candidatus Binataceae bacterium]
MRLAKQYERLAEECRDMALAAERDHSGMIEFIGHMWTYMAKQRRKRAAASAKRRRRAGR